MEGPIGCFRVSLTSTTMHCRSLYICESFVINKSLRFALAGDTFNLEMECKCKQFQNTKFNLAVLVAKSSIEHHAKGEPART